jgi:hypothetical protein
MSQVLIFESDVFFHIAYNGSRVYPVQTQPAKITSKKLKSAHSHWIIHAVIDSVFILMPGCAMNFNDFYKVQ